MVALYNLGMYITSALTGVAARFVPRGNRSKIAAFIAGRRNLMKTIAEELQTDKEKKTVWIHAASLGEFAIARPLIEHMRSSKGCNFVITFFSPSGCEEVKKDRSRYPNVFYLPWDTPQNARRFLDTVKPDAAVIMVSEYWHNYLNELHRREIPTFLVSSLIPAKSVFFKWYGDNYRKNLNCFTNIFVLDKASAANLAKLGYTHAVQTGDPLFDNAAAIAAQPFDDKVIERFAKGGRVFVAGSISDCNDLRLVASLANAHRDVKFIVVPHSLGEEHIRKTMHAFSGKTVRYSECGEETPLDGVQNMVVDAMGLLARIYRYGTWAYVGGGFTPYLHSVIEAAVYGLPVSFGPKTNRKVTPQQMMQLGIGTKVSTCRQMADWFGQLKDNGEELARIKAESIAYTRENTGATENIARTIESCL